MFVEPVPGWAASDYIFKLRGLFLDSKTYKDMVGLKNRCVTVNYAGDFELDIVPCVVERPGRTYPLEVCNRTDDRFEPTDSERYTEWFQHANNLAGNDHLIHVMRLIKYLRDTKITFSCKSVLLNTLVANQISEADIYFRPSYFPDLPTAFRTLISRLDHYLQSRPDLHKVTNPVLQIEDFNRHWDHDKYANFREMIHKYRQWTDEAYSEADEKQSVKKWRRIFGDEFAKGTDVLTEEVTGSLIPIPNFNAQRFTDAVQAIKLVGLGVLGLVRRDLPWVQRPPFVTSKQTLPISIKATVHLKENGPAAGSLASGHVLPADRHIRFEAVAGTGVPFTGKDYDVQWQVVNTDRSAGYPEQLLLDMKATHEERIKIATGITEDRATHVLRYAANIGSHSSPVSFPKVRIATFPERYPAGGQSIAIEVKGSVQTDAADLFWKLEPENLRQQFATLVKSRIDSGEINHLSVFALAPIPLLIEFGRLLGDITPADVYQLHREPAGWLWAKTGPRVCYRTTTPANNGGPVALKLSLSATITDDRITSVLGNDASIWSIHADAPANDIMRYPEDLAQFRKLVRQAYQAIKAAHGPEAVINVFPAIAVSAAVEVGRVWMPKADLPLTIFDEVRGQGFVPRLRIGH